MKTVVRILALVAAVVAVAPAQSDATLPPPPFRETVLPMKIADGDPSDPGRVYSVPVTCNQVAADFEVGCYGTSRVSSTFAKRCNLQVVTDRVLDRMRDSQNKPMYEGSAMATVEIGGQERTVCVSVMKDEYCQKPEKEGLLGYDVIKDFQWEINPVALTFTLRPATTLPAKKPLYILPLRVGEDGYYLKVRIRNVTQDLALMPGSSFIQAGLSLQHAWDLTSGEKITVDVGSRFGDVRTTWLRGNDNVELTKYLKETDLPVALIGDAKKPQFSKMLDSGLGQCVLNRYVYCVEPRRQQFRIIARTPATTRPAESDAKSK